MPQPHVVFLDTNFFYDYVEEGSIAWVEDLGARAVRLILAPAVIRELNDHKDGGHRPRLADAAQRTLARLAKRFEQSNWQQFEARPNVVMAFGADPEKVPAPLNPLLPDDYLIGSILAYKSAHPDEKVSVLTNDLGLILKARPHGIDLCRIKDKYRVPPPEDPRDNKIRRYEKILEASIPQLEPQVIAFLQDGSYRIKILINNVGAVLAQWPAMQLSYPSTTFSLPAFINLQRTISENELDDAGIPWDTFFSTPSEMLHQYQGLTVFHAKLNIASVGILRLKLQTSCDRAVGEPISFEMAREQIIAAVDGDSSRSAVIYPPRPVEPVTLR